MVRKAKYNSTSRKLEMIVFLSTHRKLSKNKRWNKTIHPPPVTYFLLAPVTYFLLAPSDVLPARPSDILPASRL